VKNAGYVIRAVDTVDMEGGKKIKLEDSWLRQIKGIEKNLCSERDVEQ